MCSSDLCHQEARCIYAFERIAGKERILAVFNFSDREQDDYKIELNRGKKLTLLLASDAQEYGGMKKYDKKEITLKNGQAALRLTPYSAIYYMIV